MEEQEGGGILSVRLDRKLAEKVRRVAAIKELTLSEVHRLALAEYCDREIPLKKTSRSEEILGKIMEEKHRCQHEH